MVSGVFCHHGWEWLWVSPRHASEYDIVAMFVAV